MEKKEEVVQKSPIDERNDIDFGEPEETILLKNKIENLEDKIKRIQADNINFRRRKEEEVSRMLKYANEDILKDIINELDNFDRALKIDDEEFKNYLDGFRLIKENFEEILKNNEVIKMESLDQEFDFNNHEAIAIDTDNKKEDNIILEVFKEGYIYKDKVIRHAAVKVNNKKEGEK